jgi:hypothetical protein
VLSLEYVVCFLLLYCLDLSEERQEKEKLEAGIFLISYLLTFFFFSLLDLTVMRNEIKWLSDELQKRSRTISMSSCEEKAGDERINCFHLPSNNSDLIMSVFQHKEEFDDRKIEELVV